MTRATAQLRSYACGHRQTSELADDFRPAFGRLSDTSWSACCTRTTNSGTVFPRYGFPRFFPRYGFSRDGFRRRGQPFDSSDAAILAEQVRSRTAPYQRTEVKDQFTRLREALEPDEQTLLFLRVDQGLSWNEVADVLAEDGERVDAAALRKRFERAKARLRKLAEAEGLLPDSTH